jgi:hypothetical protein
MNDTPDELDEDDSEEMPADDTTSRESKSRFKVGPFVIVAVLITIFAFIQVKRKDFNRAERNQAKEQQTALSENSVGMTVQWSSEEQLPLFEVPWASGMTVRDLLLDAQKSGRLTFDESGEGDSAMLIGISGTKNEGGRADSYNWTYRVNGAMGDKSFAIYELHKGDIVAWKFGPYE